MKFKQITPMVSSVLIPVWYRQSYYPYGIVSLITPMVSSVLLPLWYRQSYYPYGIVSLITPYGIVSLITPMVSSVLLQINVPAPLGSRSDFYWRW
jgi:hypothetical protein